MTAHTIPLEEAFWFQEGPGVRKWQFTTSGIKLLNVGNILPTGELHLSKTDRHLSCEEVAARYKHFLVDEGDLVIASSGISFESGGLLRTRGAFVHRSHLPLCLNTSTIRFKAKDDADLRYLRFWLDSHEFRSQITRLVTGSAQQNFGPSHLESIHITLPDLPEQKHIANLLDKADRLRRTRRYALELSDTFLPAAFLEMFGDPVMNCKQVKSSVLEDELERIESGFSPVCEGPRQTTNEWSVLGLGAVTSGVFRPEENKRLPNEIAPRPELEVQDGDVLVTRKNTYDLVAACVFVRNPPPKLLLPDTIFRFRLKANGKLIPVFLWGILSFPSFRKQVQILASGSAGSMPNISKEKFMGVRLPVPPLSLQQKFAALVECHERQRAGQQEALRQAEHLFQTLLHPAFNGGL
ncbi:MAG: restriction endonuclease subunit S [Candidatus Binatia bacterium]